jgi:death on curing protein
MRYLTLAEILEIHKSVIHQSGGSAGILNVGALESATAQPRMAFGGKELYPSLAEKAAALGYSIIQNHPFIDGNKRVGHAAMETYLVMNGHQITAPIEDQYSVILRVAAGEIKREDFTAWLRERIASTT